MVHIQNATLAGGVAMGSCANMSIAPWLCVLIGAGGGAISTVGYHAVTDTLRSKFNIDDTCGAHNLHGLPGIYGAVLSAIVVLTLDDTDAVGIVYETRTKGEQAAFQVRIRHVPLALQHTRAQVWPHNRPNSSTVRSTWYGHSSSCSASQSAWRSWVPLSRPRSPSSWLRLLSGPTQHSWTTQLS